MDTKLWIELESIQFAIFTNKAGYFIIGSRVEYLSCNLVILIKISWTLHKVIHCLYKIDTIATEKQQGLVNCNAAVLGVRRVELNGG